MEFPDLPALVSAARAKGVTTVLDMANPSPALVDSLRGLPGLTGLRSAGTPALAPGSLHARMLITDERAQIKNADQAGQFVADRVAEGSDYIKIIVGNPGPSHDQATLDALVAAAREHAKLSVAHASSFEAVEMAQPRPSKLTSAMRSPSILR